MKGQLLTMRQIDAPSLEVALRDGAQLIDVRQPFEYAEGHVPGARLVPMGQLPARVADLDRSRPVHVICATGNRSAAMVDFLAAQGFDAVNVAGGTSGWRRSGRAVVTGSNAA